MAGGGGGSPGDGSDDTDVSRSTAADEASRDLTGAPYRAIGPGAPIGRYQVVDELGSGGMATVWRARDRELRREVAIKVLFPHLSRKVDVVRRFDREARAAAGLEHPHILRVYDVGGGTEPGGDPPYIVMELVRGQSLRELAEQHAPLLGELTAAIGALLCDALAVAHAAGVVHRDVKPGNVMVAPGGRLLLADFGVAHIDDDDSLVTRTGALLGTPSFMSPEQANGARLDGRSDVYSVGATLYQLATGSLPFTGSTARVVAQILRGERVAPLRRCPAMGAPLAKAIEAMMAPDPAARPGSALEASHVLRGIAAAGGVEDVEAEVAAFAADPAAHRARRAPEVLASVMTRAEDARTRRAWPEAIALADRAAALAPDDAAVAALVERVAVGGRRRRLGMAAVVGVVGVSAIAGGVVVMVRDAGHAVAAVADGGVAVGVGDGGGGGGGDRVGAEDGGRALVAAAPVDATPPAAPVDASADRELAPVTARPKKIVAPSLAPAPSPSLAIDAGVLLVSVDAAPPDAEPPALAPAAPAHLALAMDAWCDVTVDGIPHGRADRRHRLTVGPGKHEIVCSQGPGLGEWRGTVELRAGEDRTVSGNVLRPVRVSVAIEGGDAVVIDGATYRRGAEATLRPGRYRIEIVRAGEPVAAGWVSVPRVAACRLHDRPTLDCYQGTAP